MQQRKYAVHGWNINNLPRHQGSVLRYLEGDELITGVQVCAVGGVALFNAPSSFRHSEIAHYGFAPCALAHRLAASDWHRQ